MKEWEKELVIYRLIPAPPKENDLQKYILNYLAQKEDKYISWFLHYYERTLNEKAMAIVQDYAMYGHFLDIKQAYVIGMLKALEDYDPERGVPFIIYKEYAAMREVHEYIRSMRTVSQFKVTMSICDCAKQCDFIVNLVINAMMPLWKK